MKGATAARVFADKGATFASVTVVLDQLARQDVHNVQFGVKD
jgi:biopolymer transport protein ExbD